MSETPTATILHLSDLHLGKNFQDAGGAGYSGLSVEAAGYLIKSGGVIPPMKTHDPLVLSRLRDSIEEAAEDIGAPARAFDFHVVTGDISTDADTDARFAFARDFLLNDDVPVGPGVQPFGLGLRGKGVLCVPGNHDKMLETHPARYLSGFGALPSPPPYVFAAAVPRSGQSFVFYGIDSNFYGGRTIGLGQISAATLDWLAAQLGPLPVPRADGVVRVLLLHHHPVDLPKYNPRGVRRVVEKFTGIKKARELGRRAAERFTVLREGEALLELCRGKIDLIMHGHEHFPVALYHEDSDCFVISAGTTSEASDSEKHANSFHTVRFYGRRFRVRQYNWRRGAGGFAIAFEWEGSLDHPRRLVAL